MHIDWILGSISYRLSAGTPFKFDDADLYAVAENHRHEERGPQQDGATDLGYRLDPDVITVPLHFHAASGSVLDGYRDTLRAMFKPRPANDPGIFRVTRDDGEVRQVDAYPFGRVGIRLVKEEYPGHMHKAVVQLKVPDPRWYDPVPGTATAGGGALADWWLGGLTIGTANVLEHTTSPTQGQTWTYTGTVANGNPWSIVIRSNKATAVVGADPIAVAFQASSNDDRFYFLPPTTHWAQWDGASIAVGDSVMAAGTHNYFLVSNGGTVSLYRDSTLINSGLSTRGLVGSAAHRRWRSSYTNVRFWPEALPNAAVYNLALDTTQRAGLNATLNGEDEGVALAYEGDWPAFPIIRLAGPISDPVITNTATGETLDFTGTTIGSTDFYTIDTRYGQKTVKDGGGISRLSGLSTDSDLYSFHLEPSPLATGGTNVITLGGTATGTATLMTITYYNRFIGF